MRYGLADYEWLAIKPMLPNKPRDVPRVNDRRVHGIFWVLRSGASWRDLPPHFGPCTTCYHRFVRWRRAGVWGRLIDALAAAHDAAVQMIGTSIVRVHQHGACITRNQRQSMGRSRGGLTSKIHAVVDSNGLPVRLALSLGEAHVAAIRSDSAPISPALATGSSGSSTGSDNAAESRRVTTGSLPTTLPSSSSPQSDCGCVFISPSPNFIEGKSVRLV